MTRYNILLYFTYFFIHKPMYFVLFSLPLNNLIGITAMLPKVLSDIVTGTNTVFYPLCDIQGFLLHIMHIPAAFWSNPYDTRDTVFILAAMAFDHYVAIRYNTSITPRNVLLIILLVWVLDFLLISLLFSLQTKLPRCRSTIMNVFCDNRSLLKLTCGKTILNNVIGLFNTAVMQIISVLFPISKCLHTFVAELVIFFIFEVVGTFIIVSQRFKIVSADFWYLIMGMLIFLVSPLLNPIVYGLNASEIRITLLKVLV
uniref:G-protein coupled receptors family 1 profile domain-containing protein n=1 Tax=Salmo trutta TaxID=8032 RepID=A0A674APK0_SALTR